MRKKVSFAVGAMALTLLLSSCFLVQSFAVLDYTLNPGQGTKAKFVLRPSNLDQIGGFPGPQYEFVILGVPTDGDLSVQNGRWGVNGKFGGPLLMSINGGLVAAMGSQCGSNGLNLTEITGVTWKAFITPVKIRDRNAFEQQSVVEVNFKAKAAAEGGEPIQLFGVAGEWVDDGDDTVESGDSFGCAAIESAWVHVKAA
jgi:hypothetical protein